MIGTSSNTIQLVASIMQGGKSQIFNWFVFHFERVNEKFCLLHEIEDLILPAVAMKS